MKKYLFILLCMTLALMLAACNLFFCEHSWIDATCASPQYCEICGETEGDAVGHIKGNWTLTKEATLSSVGVEEIRCTVCGESLDSRNTEQKKPKVVNNTFNFTDDELIDWANSWLNGTYNIDDSGHFDLGNDILGYRVQSDDGKNGMLLLKHDGSDEVSAIMVYFDNFVDRTALALFFGTKIHTDFNYSEASRYLANDSVYCAGDIIATTLTMEDGLEIALLSPESYMYEIISGTPLTPSDCYLSIEHNTSEYSQYFNNMWAFTVGKWGEDNSCWFWISDVTDFDLHGGLGEIKTFRGITLGVSTEKEIKAAYGRGMEFDFNKNTDIFYRSVATDKPSEFTYLANTKKVLVYDYYGQFQIAMFIDSTGIVDCIAYLDGVWYEN